MKKTAARRVFASARPGVALIFVLGLIALLSVLASLLILSLKTRLIEQAHREMAAELREAARSAIDAKLAELAEYRAAEGSVYGAGQGWGGLSEDTSGYAAATGIDLKVRVTDESARLPLNTADVALLTRIFRHLDIPDAAAERLAAAFADWTDSDDIVRNGGAEKESYTDTAGPANRPLNHTLEVLRVAGFSEWFADDSGAPNERFRQLDAITSVHADNDRPNINGAPDAVLRFLAREANDDATRIRDARDKQSPRGVFRNSAEMTTAGVPAALAARVSLVPSILRIEATASRGNISRRLEVLIRLRNGTARQISESENPGDVM